jgi:tetratricopeptide (TPR) repeat protein
MKRRLLPVIVIAVSALLAAQEHHHATSSATLGTVDFTTSCSPAVHDAVNKAVAWLHSFEYDTAREDFLKIADQDKGCAMAHWGAAMTYFHGAWGEVDQEKGAKEAARAREIAAANPKTTPREKEYIEAVSAIYSEPEATIVGRARKFSEGMEKVHASNPDDDEAAIFYAVALYDSSGRDKTYANQRKCGEILEPLFKKLPNHPGIAHYLIHCYDNPALAQQGLSAAREYAKIAPDSAHATHMPSHIFVRLGYWDDTVQSNLASIRVAEAEPGPCHGRGSELHAMHFLQFAYLQQGKQAEAKRVAEKALQLPTENKCDSGAYVAASYVLDAHDWELAKKLDFSSSLDDPNGDETILTAIGIAAARTGDLVRAQKAEQGLAAVRDLVAKKISGGTNNSVEASRLEVAAWIAQAQHDSAKALEFMRRADEIGGYPSWVQPLPAEQLGDLFLEQKQPEQALAAYQKALDNTPNLFNGLYGAACAAKAAGKNEAAATYFRKLIEVAGRGDRQEVAASQKQLDELRNKGAE